MTVTKIYSIKNVLKEQLMRTLYVFFYLKTRQEIRTGAVVSFRLSKKKTRRTNRQTDARQIIMGKLHLKVHTLLAQPLSYKICTGH